MSVLPVSAIIPTLNAAAGLPATLAALRGQVAEIIIADGGSSDGTVELAEAAGACVLMGGRGRGPQLRAAGEAATQPWLLAMHADTRPGPGWREAVERFIAEPKNTTKAAHFRFALDDALPEARRLEAGAMAGMRAQRGTCSASRSGSRAFRLSALRGSIRAAADRLW